MSGSLNEAEALFCDSDKLDCSMSNPMTLSDQGAGRHILRLVHQMHPGPSVRYKEASEIPSRKRAMYQRRYAMFDEIAQEIRVAYKRFAADGGRST